MSVSNFVRINEPVAVSGENEPGIGIADLKIGEEPHDAFGRRDAAQRLARLWRPEVPLPLGNAILAASLRDGVLNADLIIEPSNIKQPQTQRLAPSHSADGPQVG